MQECKQECTRIFEDSNRECNIIFSNASRNCNADRNAAIRQCLQLRGRQIFPCLRDAIINSSQCLRQARISHNNCLAQAFANRQACSNFCESESPKIIISEIYYETNPDDVQSEFVELYVEDDKGNKNIDVKNWHITTFDDDKGILPNITGLDNFDHISVRMGSGINDTNASDGNATIFLARNSAMLDNNGDEVGLYNNFDLLQDFVRYEGGNGDLVLGNWQSSDLGPSADNNQESIQMHGKDNDGSSNWISAPPSEAMPNIFQFFMPAGNGVVVQMHNGLPENEEIPADAVFRGIKFDVRNASRMANLSELQVIEEFLNFSWNFYENKGFNEPEFNGDNDLEVEITTNGDYGAETDLTGIKIDIGNQSLKGTIYGVFVKWNIEHEHYHSIQLKLIGQDGKNKSDGDFVRLHLPGFGVLNDGPAEYWGLEITKKEFNMSTLQVWNISDFIRNTTPGFTSIPYTLKELAKTFDTNFTEMGTGTLEVYYKGYLFSRYIAETFNESKLVHIHNITRFNISGGSGNLQGADVLEKALRDQGINLSFFELYRNWTVWVYDNFKDSIGYTMDKKFNGTKIVENDTLTPYGTDYERIRSASEGFDFKFEGAANQGYSITVIQEKPDGTKSVRHYMFNTSTIIRIDNGSSNVTIIKTRIDGTPGLLPYGVTVKPLEPRKPKFILDGVSSIFNVSDDNKTMILRIHALSRFLNNTMHDFEIFFDEQEPKWSNANALSLPDSWQSQSFTDGLRFFTFDKPLKTCSPQEFKIEFKADKVPAFLVVHITNGTHNNIGNIASQNPKILGRNVSRCAPSNVCKGNLTNFTIETEMICMQLTGVNPIGPIKIKPTKNGSIANGSKNISLLPGRLFTDEFDVFNFDLNEQFSIEPEAAVSCVVGDPDRPYAVGAVYNSEKAPKVFPNSTNTTDVSLTIINPCHLENDFCVPIIDPGFDLFETPAFGPTYFEFDPLPPSFFDPGSDPFSGRIELKGIQNDPHNFGTTDTIVERKSPAALPGLGSSDTIPIELVALSLVSVEPITVTYGGINPELWDVAATLSHSTPPAGSMTIIKQHPQGGTFNSVLYVQPKFIFVRRHDNEVRILDTGNLLMPPKELTTTNSPWIYEPCHPEILRIPNFTSSVCPSSNQFGRINTTHNGTNVSHTVRPATADSDLDGIGNPDDNCPLNANPNQEDTDGDGVGNACDIPQCGNGVLESGEQCDDGNLNNGDGCSEFCTLECVPSYEICDNLDNDCNSVLDDGLGATTCGFGECQRTVDNCVNGVMQECIPGVPETEICDGLDNNCDGIADESFDLNNDINNCGACNILCSINHIAVNACTNGVCTGTCDLGFDDCNANKIIDGCETDIFFNNNNCGGCDTACPGGFFCNGGLCVALVDVP